MNRVHKEEADQRSPIRGFHLPRTMRYALLGGEAREQHRRLPGDIGSRIPDMYKDTLLELHYPEDVTQVLQCSLEEKCLEKERCISVRPRLKCVESLPPTIAMDRQSTFLRKEQYTTSAQETSHAFRSVIMSIGSQWYV
jgi:hypothetical protein